jgi:hypothetical protein
VACGASRRHLLSRDGDPMVHSPLGWFSSAAVRFIQPTPFRPKGVHNVHILHTDKSPKQATTQRLKSKNRPLQKLAAYA